MEKPPQNFRGPFLKAVEADDSLAVKKLLDRGLDPDAGFWFEGLTKYPICLCAEMERTTLVEVLLQAGGNVDQMDGNGRTSLHNATKSGNVKMVAFLLSKGAEVNRRISMDDRKTPLHLAADGLNLEVLRLLIDAGADVDRRNIDMKTPLVYACTQPGIFVGRRIKMSKFFPGRCGHLVASFISELLKAKSSVKSRDENGCTALHHIVQGNYFGGIAEALELLLSYPCDVDAKNRYGQTPLYLAARSNNRKAVLLLLKAGCRVDIEAGVGDVFEHRKPCLDRVNSTPVDIAITDEFYDIAELLLAAGARINREVWIAVREAIEDVDPSMLERLLATGAESPKLSNLCRRSFYDRYGTETPRLISKMPLPPLIKRYLTFEIV